MYRLIYILLFYTYFSILANDTINRVYIDSKTYEYYLSAQWKPLITLGKLANKNDIDFFYLQLRIGTAYFYRQNYRTASIFFEKALKDDPYNEYALEMLYYCYLYSGEQIKFHDHVKSLNIDILNKITKNTKPVSSSLYFEGAYIPENINSGYIINEENSSDIIEDYIQYKDQLYFSTAVSFFIHKKSNITLAYSRLQLNKNKDINLGSELFQPTINTTQNQFYIKNIYQIGKNLQLTGAFHYLNINAGIAQISRVDGVNETTNYWEYDTIINQVPVHVDVYDTLRGIRSINTESSVFTDHIKDFSIYLGIKRNFKYFNLTIGGNYSRFSLSKHYQGNFITTIFPFGNLNTYSISDITFTMHQYEKGSNLDNEIIFNQTLGQKITPFLWIEAYYTKGNMKDVVFNEAFLVYNSIFRINEKMGVSLIFPIKNLSFILHYQYLKKEDYVLNYSLQEGETYTAQGKEVYISSWEDEQQTGGNGPGTGAGQIVTQREEFPYTVDLVSYETVTEINKYQFNHHLILGGILWKF